MFNAGNWKSTITLFLGAINQHRYKNVVKESWEWRWYYVQSIETLLSYGRNKIIAATGDIKWAGEINWILKKYTFSIVGWTGGQLYSSCNLKVLDSTRIGQI